jgi:hypothetical protein
MSNVGYHGRIQVICVEFRRIHSAGATGKPVNKNGFSDHFPVVMTVTEID